MFFSIIGIIAIIVGPIAAVAITLWHQDRKQKLDAKTRLFLTLMAHRKILPPTFDLVNSLNLIDVIFADHPRVVALWHEYFDLLCQTPIIEPNAQRKYLDLLSEMAKSLDYETLSQTDIDRFYSPIAHGTQAQLNLETQKEFLRVLQNTARFVVDKKGVGQSALQ